ncbi:RNA polymerase factor sigma-54 [Hydrocarboniphaga effusa]|jgi:RNA polymerase sigma-54 factor
MSAKPQLRMQAGQSQVMTQQLLQSIRLLQLNSQELELEVTQALESNLLLEADDKLDDELEAPSEPNAEATVDSIDQNGSEAESVREVSGADAGAHREVEADFDWSSSESWSGGEPPEEDGEPASARVAEALPSDPRLQALAQLQLVVTEAREAELVAAIIDAVDDSGYLSESLEDIVARHTQGYTIAEAEAALRRVQSVEPTGFAARSLSECLSLQLEALPVGTKGRLIALEIVREHIGALASLTEGALASLLDYRIGQIHQALLLIKSLDPKPGASGAVAAQAVVPEIIVSGRPGAWRVELNPETLPRVRINRGYEKAIGGPGAAARFKALRDQLNEARWLVRGLEMRQETLIRTARTVFERQREFLIRGEEAMAPLNLMDVANAIGVHESTVSRVVANKYALTPWGVYPLKAFFPVQIAGREAETSGTAVRAMIRKIIDAENRARPLSDGEVAALLARRGVNVARRTVAKYREGMRIPPAPERMLPLQRATA